MSTLGRVKQWNPLNGGIVEAPKRAWILSIPCKGNFGLITEDFTICMKNCVEVPEHPPAKTCKNFL